MSTERNDNELRMDPQALYREEIFTDRRVGTIRVLTPVTREGVTDPARKILFVGETQVLTPGGLLPIAFEIEAGSLAEAVDRFGQEARDALEDTIRELQELRREAASSIVIPETLPSGLLGPGAPGAPGPLGGLGARPRGGGIIHRP